MTTFTPDQLCFFDTETRAEPGTGDDGDLKQAGTYRYMQNAFAVIMTYAFGDKIGVGIQALDRGFDRDWLRWQDTTSEFKKFYERAEKGKAWYAAFNAGFDRQAWNEGTADYPHMRADMIIDVKAQAAASNLPDNLEGCSRFVGSGGKQDDGKALIKLFAPADGGTPQSHPDEWWRYKQYAIRDTAELKTVFEHTRQLPLSEWQEYWTSERINDRGMAVDLDFCRKASAVAALDAVRTNRLLTQLTEGVVTTVGQHARIANWIWDNVSTSEARDLLVTDYDEDAEDDMIVCSLSANRQNITKLITYLEAREAELDELDYRILKVARLREFGASAAPKKFDTILAQHDRGILKGSYVFNGAGQSGRFSSKGVQVHNMTRDVLGKDGCDEVTAIEMINELEI